MKQDQQKTAFEQCFDTANSRLKMTQREFEKVEMYLKSNDITDAYEAAFDFAYSAEQLTLIARTMPIYTGHPQAQKRMEDQMIETVPIKIGFTQEGWFCVKIPALLPKKQKGGPEYISGALWPAMQRFFDGKDRIRYPKSVIIYRHVFDRNHPERANRDHDNNEINMVTDIVAFYVMHDDSPQWCEHYYCSDAGDEDETQVFVVPQDEFQNWFYSMENGEDKDIYLYESIPEQLQE